MAAALAASVLPEVAVESAAGVMPGDAVAEKAISVVKEMTGLDISSYRPRDLAEVDLTAFDRIVVLDVVPTSVVDEPRDRRPASQRGVGPAQIVEPDPPGQGPQPLGV